MLLNDIIFCSYMYILILYEIIHFKIIVMWVCTFFCTCVFFQNSCMYMCVYLISADQGHWSFGQWSHILNTSTCPKKPKNTNTLNPSKQPKDGLRDYGFLSPSSFHTFQNALSIREQSPKSSLKCPEFVQLQLQPKHMLFLLCKVHNRHVLCAILG